MSNLPDWMVHLVVYHPKSDTILEAYLVQSSMSISGREEFKTGRTYRLYHPDFNASYNLIETENGRLPRNSAFVILGDL